MAGVKDWGEGAVGYWGGSWVFGRRVLVLGVKWGGAGAYMIGKKEVFWVSG